MDFTVLKILGEENPSTKNTDTIHAVQDLFICFSFKGV